MATDTENTDKAVKEEKKAPEVTAAAETSNEEPKKIRRSKKKTVTSGIVYINAGFNNTIVTIADEDGKTLCWSSSGASGFKGSKKSTPYASQMAAENAAEKAKSFGFEKADVYIKGVGTGREQALRGLISNGIEVLKIVDLTPVPHNGCRKPRARRN
ncbi:30S ribosomal protein S11 [Patescibacteria group bacterium]|nr:30S ribosomal protein S11 [Patescibacteria group bacterium]